MKLDTNNQSFFDKSAVWFSTIIRFALYLLLLITTLAILVGIVKSGVNLASSLHDSLSTILEGVLLDAVFIIALVEITITILGYLKDGSVHVRYIVDTVLIIMLNEIVAMWFKHPSLENSISLSLIIATLALVRISVTRFAPSKSSK